MLAKRVIPCLDVKDGRVVKGVRFVGLRDAGDPTEAAERYDEGGADEITFLDITASHETRGTLLSVVERTSARIFTPLTVGGGVRSEADVEALFNAGADKVAINTSAVNDPSLVQRAAQRWGSQAIVVAIDARSRGSGAGWTVVTHGGRRDTGRDAVEWARTIVGLGAGEILLDEHGLRWHQEWLRPRAHARRRGCGERARCRLGWRGNPRSSARRGDGGRRRRSPSGVDLPRWRVLDSAGQGVPRGGAWRPRAPPLARRWKPWRRRPATRGPQRMNQGHVTLSDVLAAARVRAASLVPETAGYLTVAIGNAISLLPIALDDASIVLTTEGTVTMTRRGEVLTDAQAACGFRSVLARLLSASIGMMPGLTAAAEPRPTLEVDMASVQREIEAALVPLNRAAARRALARLARETQRAFDSGQVPEASSPPVLRTQTSEPVPSAAAPGSASAEAAQVVGPQNVLPQPEAPPKNVAPMPTPPEPPIAPAEPTIASPSIDVDAMAVSEPTPTTIGMPPMDCDSELASLPPAVYGAAPPAEQPTRPFLLRKHAFAAASTYVAQRTRADELIQSFGASCSEDAEMVAAAACLRSFAGVVLHEDLTKPGLIDLRHSPIAPPAQSCPRVVVHRFDSPVQAHVPRKLPRKRWGAPIGVLVATLLLGMGCVACAVTLNPGILQHLGFDAFVAELPWRPAVR